MEQLDEVVETLSNAESVHTACTDTKILWSDVYELRSKVQRIETSKGREET